MNAIPIVDWILSLVFTASTSVPFWIVWTSCGIGRRYFYFVPEVYQSVPFWHCVGLFTVIGILKRVLTPNFASVTQTNSNKDQ